MKGQPQGGFLVGRIRQAAARVFAGILQAHGISLTPAQGRILFPLWRDGAMPITKIAARAGLGKSTLTSLLDTLEQDGLVRRVRSQDDRRVILIEAVSGDIPSQEAYLAASREMADRFYAGFSPEEIERFERDLVRVLHNLTSSSPARPD